MCRQDTKAVPTALTGALGSKNTNYNFIVVNVMMWENSRDREFPNYIIYTTLSNK